MSLLTKKSKLSSLKTKFSTFVEDGIGFSDLYSAQFVAASSQYAYISNADFGAYSDTKVTLVLSAKRDSTGAAVHALFTQAGAIAAQQRIWAYFQNDFITLFIRDSAGTAYSIATNNQFTSTIDTYNIELIVDLDNVAQNDRVRIRVDDVEQAVTGVRPTAGKVLKTVTADILIGKLVATQEFDGQLNDVTLYSDAIPAYSDSWDGSDRPIGRSAVTGHYMTAKFENDFTLVGIATDLTPVNGLGFVSNP